MLKSLGLRFNLPRWQVYLFMFCGSLGGAVALIALYFIAYFALSPMAHGILGK